MAIDPAGGRIYWANFATGMVRSAKLSDGSDVQNLATGESGPCGVAIDPAANRIYWAEFNGGRVRFDDLDDTNAEDPKNLATGQSPLGVAIDPAAGRIYWANFGTGEVKFDDLDDTNLEDPKNLATGEPTSGPHGVAIDPAALPAGRIYWANFGAGHIRFDDLDHTNAEDPKDLATGEGGPTGVAVDPAAGRIYWANFSAGEVRFDDLDHTNAEDPKDLATGEGTFGPNYPALLHKPLGTGAPTISGGTQVCAQLSCSQGNWAPDLLGAFLFRAPRSFAYQWQKDGNDISGADQSTFSPTEAGDYTCRVTAENQAGSTSQTSAPTTVTACDDGLFCNGTETCNGTVCVLSTNPCPGPDGDASCAESCNEGLDNCFAPDPNGSTCNDGLFCNGTDTCNATGGCTVHAGNPCPGHNVGPACNDSCTEALGGSCTAPDPNGSACNDGLFCNGSDTCTGGMCSTHTGNPCPGPDGDANCAESCNETADNCMAADPEGSACAPDNNACTFDQCHAGVCTHVPNTVGCGTTTTTSGTTSTVTTTSTAGTTTTTLPSCAAAPGAGCQAAAKASLLLRNASPDDKDKLNWKWASSAAVASADFGNPVTTSDYLLCVYGNGALKLEAVMPKGGTCAGKPCWKSTASGFKYKDKELSPDGIRKLLLKAGNPGKIILGGKGANLGVPTLPLDPPVLVQLRRADGPSCWESAIGVPLLNDASGFLGRSD